MKPEPGSQHHCELHFSDQRLTRIHMESGPSFKADIYFASSSRSKDVLTLRKPALLFVLMLLTYKMSKRAQVPSFAFSGLRKGSLAASLFFHWYKADWLLGSNMRFDMLPSAIQRFRLMSDQIFTPTRAHAPGELTIIIDTFKLPRSNVVVLVDDARASDAELTRLYDRIYVRCWRHTAVDKTVYEKEKPATLMRDAPQPVVEEEASNPHPWMASNEVDWSRFGSGAQYLHYSDMPQVADAMDNIWRPQTSETLWGSWNPIGNYNFYRTTLPPFPDPCKAFSVLVFTFRYFGRSSRIPAHECIEQHVKKITSILPLLKFPDVRPGLLHWDVAQAFRAALAASCAVYRYPKIRRDELESLTLGEDCVRTPGRSLPHRLLYDPFLVLYSSAYFIIRSRGQRDLIPFCQREIRRVISFMAKTEAREPHNLGFMSIAASYIRFFDWLMPNNSFSDLLTFLANEVRLAGRGLLEECLPPRKKSIMDYYGPETGCYVARLMNLLKEYHRATSPRQNRMQEQIEAAVLGWKCNSLENYRQYTKAADASLTVCFLEALCEPAAIKRHAQVFLRKVR